MVIGIDLGTTFSAAAYVDGDGKAQIIPNREGERTTPSVVLFDGDQPIVGKEAKANSVINPYGTVEFVKRKMGERFEFEAEDDVVYSAEDISAMILKRLKEDSQNFLGMELRDAVITVPAYFDDAQRKATQDAGRIAGFHVLAVLNEPTAAALAYGMANKEMSAKILVYDLGGGTFDVTILNLAPGKIDILATNGHKNLGGFDFDNRIISYMIEQFEKAYGIDLSDDDNAMQELREKAETAKKTLSARQKTKVSIFSQGHPLQVEITRELFEELTEDLVAQTETILDMAMEDANVSWADIDRILLIGGSSRMPCVQESVKEMSGKELSMDINPDEAVAMGAAYYAVSLQANGGQGAPEGGDSKNIPEELHIKEEAVKEIADTRITDVSSHSLGMIAEDDEGRSRNWIILPRNSALPAEASCDDFVTMCDNQKEILVQITQGEDEDPGYVTIIGETELRLQPRPAGSPLRVVLGYDKNSMIHVRVIDLVDGSDLGEMEIERKSNLDDRSVRRKTERLSKLDID